MKPIFLSLTLLFCLPVCHADDTETPAQKQTLVAQATVEIDTLKKVVPADGGGDWNAVQGAAQKLMTQYVYRAQLYEDLKEWKKAEWDYYLANDARFKLRNQQYEQQSAFEFLLLTRRAYCLLQIGDAEKAQRSMSDARQAKGWENRIGRDSLVGAMINLVLNKSDAALSDALDAQTRKQTVPRDALVAQSLAYFQKGDLEKAQSAWDEALKIDPAYKVVRLFTPAMAKLNAGIAQNPTDARAWYLRGFSYQNSGDIYGRLGIKDAEYSGTWMCLPTDFLNFVSGSIYFWDAAQRDFSRSFDLNKNSLALVRRAQCLYQLSKNKSAEKKNLLPPNSTWRADAKQVLKIGYDDFDAMHSLAFLQDQIADDTAAAPIRSQNARVDANFANSLAVLRHPEEKLGSFYRENITKSADKLIANTKKTGGVAPSLPEPKTALQWKEQGNQENAAGHLAGALQAYRRALEIDPKFADAQNNIGNIYTGVGDYPRALEAFRAAIALDPKHRVAHANVAANLFKLGMIQESLAAANLAVQYASTPELKTNALDIRATNYIRLKDDAHALADLRAQTVLYPAKARPWQRIGMITLAAADMNGAREAFQKSLDAGPKDNFVRVLLAMATNGDQLQQMAKAKGADMKSLRYSEWEAISPAAQTLLAAATLESSEIDLLLEYWNETILASELAKEPNRPLQTSCLQVLRTAIDIKPLTFQGDART